MKDLVDDLAAEHFGEVMEKTIHYLGIGESVLIYGMPGCGLKHFLRLAKKRLEGKNESKILFIECQAYPSGLLEQIKNGLNKTGGDRTVLILSHIETIIDQQKEVVRYLLGLRNANPANFCLLSSCNYDFLVRQQDYFEAGGVLFGTLFKIPLFDFEGTKRILLTNQTHFGFRYRETDFQKIYELSGGNPGLVKHIGKCVDDWGENVLDNPEVLAIYPSVAIKLGELARVIITQKNSILESLEMINSSGKLFSPLLKIYLQKYESENIDKILPELTVQERKIFSYLLANQNRMVDIDKIAFLMGLNDETFSLWAIYKAVSRLKKRINGVYRIETIKGKGYRLLVGQK